MIVGIEEKEIWWGSRRSSKEVVGKQFIYKTREV